MRRTVYGVENVVFLGAPAALALENDIPAVRDDTNLVRVIIRSRRKLDAGKG